MDDLRFEDNFEEQEPDVGQGPGPAGQEPVQNGANTTPSRKKQRREWTQVETIKVLEDRTKWM